MSDRNELINQLADAYAEDAKIPWSGDESEASWGYIRTLKSQMTKGDQEEAWRRYCEGTR